MTGVVDGLERVAGPDLIEFVVDKNVYKQGKFMPGSHIPIVAPAVLAGPCIRRGLSLAALLEPVDGLDSAPHGPVLVLVPDLAPPGLAPVVLGA